MKHLKYILSLLLTALVVFFSIWLPPAISRQHDEQFLNKVQADSADFSSYRFQSSSMEEKFIILADYWEGKSTVVKDSRDITDPSLRQELAQRFSTELMKLEEEGVLPSGFDFSSYGLDASSLQLGWMNSYTLYSTEMPNQVFSFTAVTMTNDMNTYAGTMDESTGKICILEIENKYDSGLITSPYESALGFLNYHDLSGGDDLLGEYSEGSIGEQYLYQTMDSSYQVQCIYEWYDKFIIRILPERSTNNQSNSYSSKVNE